MISKLTNTSLALCLFSTIDEVDATFPIDEDPLLNTKASCAHCLKGGFVYVYDGREESQDTGTHYLEVSPEEGFTVKKMSTLKGKCCKKSTSGSYTCKNDAKAEENLRWERVQYKGYAAAKYQTAKAPDMRKYWNKAVVQLKMTEKYDAYLTTPAASEDAYNHEEFQNLYKHLTQKYCNTLLSLGGNATKIYDKLELIDKYYDKYNANTWWKEFTKLMDTCYDDKKGTMTEAERKTAAAKIVQDWDPFIFFGWADEVLKSPGKGKLIEKELGLVEEFESKNLRGQYETRLIGAFDKSQNDKLAEGKAELEAVNKELEQYTYFYEKIDIRNVKLLRKYLTRIQTVEGEARYQTYFTDMGKIKTSFNKSGYDALAAFDDLLLWTFWEEREGSKYVDIARYALTKLPKTKPAPVKDKDGNDLPPEPSLHDNYYGRLVGQKTEIEAGLIPGAKDFKDLLVEMYYVSEVGEKQYKRFVKLNDDSALYGEDPAVRKTLLEENMEYEDPTYLKEALWELEFWQYWVDNKTLDKTAEIKDNFAQVADQGIGGEPEGMGTDTQKMFLAFYNEQMAALERAYTLQDLYAFDYIAQLLSDKIPDVYRGFWNLVIASPRTASAPSDSDLTTAKNLFEDLRREFGIPWAKNFAAYYKDGSEDFTAIKNKLDDWNFIKDTGDATVDSNGVFLNKVDRNAREVALTISRGASRGTPEDGVLITGDYYNGMMSKLRAEASLAVADKAAKYNEILAQYQYQAQMFAYLSSDQLQKQKAQLLASMGKAEIDGTAGKTLTDDEKTTLKITEANTYQKALKLTALTSGWKGQVYRKQLDLVPVMYKFTDHGLVGHTKVLWMADNIKKMVERTPERAAEVNAGFYTTLLQEIVSDETWFNRLITLSEYGLQVSFDTIGKTLDRWGNLFIDKEPEPAYDPQPHYTLAVGPPRVPASYKTMVDPLVTKWLAMFAAPNDTTKAVVRKDFEDVNAEIDIYWSLAQEDKEPSCDHTVDGCPNFVLYDYSTYYKATTGKKFQEPAGAKQLQHLLNITQFSMHVYGKMQKLKKEGETDTLRKAMYDKYYQELKDNHFTWYKLNKGTYKKNLLEWYQRFIWAYWGYEKSYASFEKNLAKIQTLYLDNNFISFLLNRLSKVTGVYHSVAESKTDTPTSYAGLDTIELFEAITYWYLNSGAFDAYACITYAFDTLPEHVGDGKDKHAMQRTKLAYFKQMTIRSMKQKDLFLLKAGLDSVSDEYIKLYDPSFVTLFNKLDTYMNRVERDGYKVISLIKRLNTLYEYFVTKNDRDKMQLGKNAVDLWGTDLLDNLNEMNAKARARETLLVQFTELAKKKYNKETNCEYEVDKDGQNTAKYQTCIDLYEKTLKPIFVKALLKNVDDYISEVAQNDIPNNIDLYERLLYIAENTKPTEKEYERVFLVMVEDLIFRGYEKFTNANRRAQAQKNWAKQRKQNGADLVNEYITNRFPMKKEWTIRDPELEAWVEGIDQFAKCKTEGFKEDDDVSPENNHKLTKSECDTIMEKKAYPAPSPVVGSAPIVGAATPTKEEKAEWAKVKKMLTSDEIVTNDLQLTACPHDKTKCGPKNIVFKNEDSFDYKIKIENMTGADSCHWLIKAECGLPAVQITEISSSLERQLEIHFLEWQANGPNVEMDAFYKDYPAMYNPTIYVPDIWNHYQGELGEVVFDVTAYPKNISFQAKKKMTKFWRYVMGSVIESEVNRLKDTNALYEWKIGKWREVADEYENGIRDIENLIESNDNQSPTNFYAQVYFGGIMQDTVKDMVAALPVVPPLPDPPSQKIDISKDDAIVVSGYGSLTSGYIALRGKGGTLKSFGVFGQGLASNKGYLSIPEKDKGADGKRVCYNKYIALNLYPLDRNFEQVMTGTYAQELVLTASSQKTSKHDLYPPILPDPPGALIDFSAGTQFFLDNGASYLTAGVASAALVAATLF